MKLTLSNSARKIIKKYHFNSTFFQYFRKILLYFSVPCIFLCGIIYFTYVRYYNSITENSVTTSFEKIKNTTMNIFSEIYKRKIMFGTDNTVLSCLLLNENDWYTPKNLEYTQYVNKLISSTILTSDYINSIYLYCPKYDYVYSSYSPNPLESFYNTTWYEYFKKNNASAFVYSCSDKFTNDECISAVFPIERNSNLLGILVFNINKSVFSQMLSLNTESETAYLFFNDELIYSSKDGAVAEYDKLAQDFSIQKTKNSIICTESLGDYNLFLRMDTGISELVNTKNFTLIILLILTASALVIPFIISFFVSMNVYTSIAGIVIKLQNVYGNTDMEYTKNEIEYINSNIIKLISHSKNVEQDLAENINKLKHAQIISLQTQLNPHFLYNTLNSVTMLAAGKNISEIDVLIRNLSDLLTYSLDTQNTFVTIRQEMMYTTYYINIEEIKYETKYNINWNIPNEQYEVKILKFIFQPIIENTLRHGFKHKSGDLLTLTVSSEVSGNKIRFTFYDTGCGIKKPELIKIRENLKTSAFPETKNIGIYNVNLRIKLIFGDEYGVDIDSEENKFTKVTITLPV